MVQIKKKAAVAPKARKQKRDKAKKFGKKVDLAEFRAQLDSLGLKIVEVTSDGNCFFRAMGDQLEGSEEEHMKYRAMVVEYIVKHREEFEPFIEDEVPFDEYCDSMLKDGTWAGHMELQAASLVTRRNICIHMLNSPRWYINNFPGREATNMVHLSYHDGEHYNSVRLREDPCQGPAVPIVIKTDANISSTNNNGQTKAKDLKRSSHRSTYDHTSIKLVMAGTGCSDVAVAEHVLAEMDGDVDAAIEYMIAERLAVGTDDAEGDPYMDYVCNGYELGKGQDENQVIDHKDEASCSSRVETVEKPKSSESKKENPKTKDCSCGSARKHKASCSLATVAPSREPPRNKGGQGKGQKGKKQKKKEQAEAKPVQQSSVAVPDLGALCI